MKDYRTENHKFGSLLLEARLDSGLTQKKAAEIFHTGTRTIQNWEYGSCAPSFPMSVDYIENVLGLNSRKYFHLYLNPNYTLYDSISLDELDARQRLAKLVMYGMPIEKVNAMLQIFE